MKYLLMLGLSTALFAGSVGCCAHGGCGGGACGAPSYYGGYPTGAYSGGTTTSAAIPAPASYAYSPIYPATAGLPINSLPTY